MKGENSIKLFGSDLGTLTKTADEIKSVLQSVPGIADLAVFNSVGQPTIRIDVDRIAAGCYGLAPGDINAAVQTAIGGQAAGNVYEDSSDRHFPIIVRLAQRYRQSIESIDRLTIGGQNPATNNVTQIRRPIANCLGHPNERRDQRLAAARNCRNETYLGDVYSRKLNQWTALAFKLPFVANPA